MNGMEIRLIYVEEFESKLHSGIDYPRVGEIYRAVKRRGHKNQDMYQMFFDLEGEKVNLGMFVPGLEVDNPVFSCKMKEVTIEEILDLDVGEATFKRLESWGPKFSDGLTEEDLNIPIMNGKADTDQVTAIAEKLTTAINEATETMRGNKGMHKLADSDANTFKAISYLVDYIVDTQADKYLASPIGNPGLKLIYTEDYGKGINVFNAIKYLQRYMTDGYDKSDNPADVVKAIHYLIFELTRLIIHGKIKA